MDQKSGSSIIDDRGKLEPEDLIKAQLNVVVRGRQIGLSNIESKEVLDALGIAERVRLDEDQGDTEG